MSEYDFLPSNQMILIENIPQNKQQEDAINQELGFSVQMSEKSTCVVRALTGTSVDPVIDVGDLIIVYSHAVEESEFYEQTFQMVKRSDILGKLRKR